MPGEPVLARLAHHLRETAPCPCAAAGSAKGSHFTPSVFCSDLLPALEVSPGLLEREVLSSLFHPNLSQTRRAALPEAVRGGFFVPRKVQDLALTGPCTFGPRSQSLLADPSLEAFGWSH